MAAKISSIIGNSFQYYNNIVNGIRLRLLIPLGPNARYYFARTFRMVLEGGRGIRGVAEKMAQLCSCFWQRERERKRECVRSGAGMSATERETVLLCLVVLRDRLETATQHDDNLQKEIY